MATQRSRRLSKKLALGEFAELAFEVRFSDTESAWLDTLGNLAREVLVKNGMVFHAEEEPAGRIVVRDSRFRSLTQSDWEKVADWVGRETNSATCQIGPLVDVRHLYGGTRFVLRRRRVTIFVISPGGKTKYCRTGIGRGRYPG